MSLRTSIHACLKADSAVLALIPAGADIRHYAERSPQDPVWPYAVSNIITGTPQQTHGKPGDAEDTLDETDVQFSCPAATEDAAEGLALAIRAALMNDANGILAAAKIVVTSPQYRMQDNDALPAYVGLLDVTFFHNPQT